MPKPLHEYMRETSAEKFLAGWIKVGEATEVRIEDVAEAYQNQVIDPGNARLEYLKNLLGEEEKRGIIPPA